MAVYDFVQPGHTMGLRLLSQIISNPRTGFMAFFWMGCPTWPKRPVFADDAGGLPCSQGICLRPIIGALGFCSERLSACQFIFFIVLRPLRAPRDAAGDGVSVALLAGSG
jgi:hypothetical protein